MDRREKSWKTILIDILETNRGLVILLFCLPASFVFNLILQLQKRLYRVFLSGPQRHNDRVAEIQKHVQLWNKLPKDSRKHLCTSRPNWMSLSTTFFKKDACHQIDVNLFDVLELDEKNLTVRVEPMVTVDDITKYLLPKGYTLAVTLEIGDATLGGLAMGTGMTTHSHKVGLYQENVESYEVVLGDGTFIKADAKNHSDLYKCLPWSHGSLGFLVAITLKIIPVKKYVHMKYIPVHGMTAYCKKMREISLTDVDYLEATIYEKDKAVIMVGIFSDYDSTLNINELTTWYKPWFHRYVQGFLDSGPYTELIPLRDYLLRHNRSIFWVVESMIPFGNWPLFRLLFGWLLPPKPAFLKFTTTPGIRSYTFTKQVFQDIVLPMNKLEDQIKIAEELFDCYPLLVYPCRIYDHGEHTGQLKRPREADLVPGEKFAMYNDLGIYGVPGHVVKKKPYNPVTTMRKMEKFTRDVGGFSFLYADIFMTREEFEEMFDLTLYEAVRKTYKAEGAFPHLYDKVKPEIDVLKME